MLIEIMNDKRLIHVCQYNEYAMERWILLYILWKRFW